MDKDHPYMVLREAGFSREQIAALYRVWSDPKAHDALDEVLHPPPTKDERKE